jgi:hypothetical protein
MPRKKKILEFRRRHRIEKTPLPPKRPKRQLRWRRIGGRTQDMWGPYYWLWGFRTWMLITGLGPPIALSVAWLNGWLNEGF